MRITWDEYRIGRANRGIEVIELLIRRLLFHFGVSGYFVGRIREWGDLSAALTWRNHTRV